MINASEFSKSKNLEKDISVYFLFQKKLQKISLLESLANLMRLKQHLKLGNY